MSKFVMLGVVSALLVSGFSLARAQAPQNMVASFYDMSDVQFSVEAIAPPQVIREYAICKAVWFAEKKKAQKMSLGDPVYNKPRSDTQRLNQIPAGWSTLNTTAYLAEPNPSGNPTVGVGERAAQCRQMWDWYR